MPYERKYDKVDLTETEIHIGETDAASAWFEAITHVQMGVAVTPILVNQPTYNDKNEIVITDQTDLAESIEAADYVTDSGREGQFYMVMIDRHNTGEFKSLTPCSDYYIAVEPAAIYRSLRQMLEGCDAQPSYVYNSYNGGQQLLKVEIRGLKDVTIQNLPGIKMELLMRTSLDKSSNHAVSIRPVMEDGTPILFSDTKGHGYNFKIRHTTGAKAEITNFNAAVAGIAQNWNDKIVPFVQFLGGGDFEQQDISALMENIIADSDLPKDVAKEIDTAFKARTVNVADDLNSDALRVITTVSRIIEDRDVTPMAKQRDTDKVTKAVTKNVQRLFRKYNTK